MSTLAVNGDNLGLLYPRVTVAGMLIDTWMLRRLEVARFYTHFPEADPKEDCTGSDLAAISRAFQSMGMSKVSALSMTKSAPETSRSMARNAWSEIPCRDASWGECLSELQRCDPEGIGAVFLSIAGVIHVFDEKRRIVEKQLGSIIEVSYYRLHGGRLMLVLESDVLACACSDNDSTIVACLYANPKVCEVLARADCAFSARLDARLQALNTASDSDVRSEDASDCVLIVSSESPPTLRGNVELAKLNAPLFNVLTRELHRELTFGRTKWTAAE